MTVESSAAKVTVFAFGMPSSGVPARWTAAKERPGVNVVDKATDGAATDLMQRIGNAKGRGDLVVVSVHWGSNWGYEVLAGDVRLGHRLVDAGADVVFGHSSHHPRPIEVLPGETRALMAVATSSTTMRGSLGTRITATTSDC